MVTAFPCVFCFDRRDRENVNIQEEYKTDYQDIIECSKRLLKGQIERDFSFGISMQEICADCFECSEKIYKINKQLITIQERLKCMVSDFVGKINFRVSNSATETCSLENEVKVEADDDFSLKEEPINKTDNEDEESNVDFANESYPVFNFNSDSEQDDLLSVETVNEDESESNRDDNEIDQEDFSTSNPMNEPKIHLPRVVSPRLQSDKTGKPRITNNSPIQRTIPVKSYSTILVKTNIGNEKQYKCSTCGKIFPKRKGMHQHLKLHSSAKSYQCETCGRLFQTYGTYRNHLISHKEDLRCHQCNKTYSTKYGLTRHKRMHSKTRPFICDVCGKGFLRRIFLKKHSLIHIVGEFKCDFCGTIKNDKKSFTEHIKVHNNPSKFVCAFCGVKTPSNGVLIDHIRTVHEKILEQQCSTCGKKFGSKRNLERHEETHKTESERKKYNCNICSLAFPDDRNLAPHKAAYHTAYTSGYIYCDKCQSKFINGCEMFYHSPPSVTSTSKCIYCKETFKSRCNLLSHLANFHPAEKNPYKCKTCQAVFRLESLRKHSPNCNISDLNSFVSSGDPQQETLRCKKPKSPSEEDNSKKPKKVVYNCSICEESFTAKRKLRKHKKTHKEIHHMCQACNIEFPTSNELKEHKLQSHFDGNRFKCDLCENTYSIMKSLEIHRRIHTGENPYVCETCAEAFSSKVYLKEHRKKHMSYICDTCGKGFMKEANLDAHLKTHEYDEFKEMPFSCSTCGKSFALKSSLTRHENIHTEEQKYECKICGKLFVNSTNLKTHERKHTGEKPYSCDICGKSFSFCATWSKHKKAHNLQSLTSNF